MNLTDTIARKTPPTPWEEGDNIPWDDPDFSARMLNEHLSQEHDAASRRMAKIDEQVRWIHGELLSEQATRILDLACGPGLYTTRLARLGHTCSGIDFAPAAVAYAEAQAGSEGLACTYTRQDLREADFGGGFGLVMMLSGQFNVFRRSEARRLLDGAFDALEPGGQLLLEPQTFAIVRGDDDAPTSWYSASQGLFSSQPHFVLTERFWDDARASSTTRFLVIDAATGDVARYALTNEAYSDQQIEASLSAAGFEDVRLLPSLIGVEDASQAAHFAVVARKPA